MADNIANARKVNKAKFVCYKFENTLGNFVNAVHRYTDRTAVSTAFRNLKMNYT
jgi:hypothetical protein